MLRHVTLLWEGWLKAEVCGQALAKLRVLVHTADGELMRTRNLREIVDGRACEKKQSPCMLSTSLDGREGELGRAGAGKDTDE